MDRNEAIKVIKDNLTEIRPQLSEAIQILIPELKESEDEKIRYFLINFIKINDGVNISPDDAKKALAWIERQGEHANFRNKIQIGDEVTRNEDNKLAWSEEDENAAEVLINIIKKSEIIDSVIYTKTVKEKLYDWLKSLKNRTQPQSKQKWRWSEEDERIRYAICDTLDRIDERIMEYNNQLTHQQVKDWLKLLKEKMKGE